VGGLSESLRRGERHEQIEASSASKVVLLLQHRRSRRHVGGLSESLRRGERHEQIKACSASEASYYYNIGAVAASSVGRVRVFGHEHRGQQRLIVVLLLQHRRSRRHVGGLSESLRRGERHEQIEASSASKSSYYYNIGAVAATSVG
ncbi:hypothetical protein PR002_g32687, partial [Phytophthora rubi]